MATRGDKPRSFASRAQLRAWLQRHHASAAELNLRLFKVHARERGVTYREALDEALCFGWIDGVRRALDDESFSQRFSPRRAGSKWSVVNRRRMRELQAEGRVAAPGLAVDPVYCPCQRFPRELADRSEESGFRLADNVFRTFRGPRCRRRTTGRRGGCLVGRFNGRPSPRNA